VNIFYSRTVSNTSEQYHNKKEERERNNGDKFLLCARVALQAEGRPCPRSAEQVSTHGIELMKKVLLASHLQIGKLS